MGLAIRLSAFTGLWKDDLVPLRCTIAESMSEKATLLWIIFIVEPYEKECFYEIMESSHMNTMDAEGPQPPVVERTIARGECSMLNFYALFFHVPFFSSFHVVCNLLHLFQSN